MSGSDANHTPGPWNIAKPKIGDGGARLIYGSDRRHIAEVFQYQNHQFPAANGEALANACLIAAAPDLLNACIAILEDVRSSNALHFLAEETLDKLDEAIRMAVPRG